MTADDLQALGQAGAIVALGAYTAWKARRADQQTRATGNGFANHVRESLDRIERRTERVETKLDSHLGDHARASIERRK